jgi:diguanylate cyclase (GGDEF)-like protein
MNLFSPAPTPSPLTTAAELTLLGRLIEATTPAAAAAVIVDLATSLPACVAATVLWESHGVWQQHGAPLDTEQAARAQAALAGEICCLSPDARQAMWRLAPQASSLVSLAFSAPQAPATLPAAIAARLALASRGWRRLLTQVELLDSRQQSERAETLQRALFAISDLAGAELDMPELLLGIHTIVGSLMYAENFFIVLHDHARDTLRFLYYADTEDQQAPDTTRELPVEAWRGSLTWHMLRDGKPLMGSAEQLRKQVGGQLHTVGPDSIDWLGVPMLRDGHVCGALVVQSYREGIAYSQEDRTLLEFVGSHILTALERKRNKSELEQQVLQRTAELAQTNRGLQLEIIERQRAERLQAALFQLAQLATVDIDESTFYTQVHAVTGALLNAENFFVGLVDYAAGAITFAYAADVTGEPYLDRPLVNGLSEYVMAHGPLVVDRTGILEMVQRGLIDLDATGTLAACWLGVPLLAGNEVIGLVAVQTYSETVDYDAADQELLSFAALQIANGIYRRRSATSLHKANAELEQRVEERTRELRQQIHQREHIQQQLKHQIMHDPLTGLPNRDFLRDRLEQALIRMKSEPSQRCALLYLDVDRFKVINDSLGHLAGDEFLQAIAQRLLSCVRTPGIVVRLSGDEFAILLEDISPPATAAAVAQRILATVGEPLQIAGRELAPSLSIGIAIGTTHYHHADEVLRDADTALYRAKAGGRQRFALFDETLAKDQVDVLEMENELRQALQHDQFEPYFQPIWNCQTDNAQVVGYEALLRWNHPHRGLLKPADFLRIAEESGQIEAIDWRMFELSCRLFAQHGAGDAFLTINVSARHLCHTDFDARLLDLLKRTGLAPARLVVEVTEGALLDDPELVRATLERLRTVGVGAALDDFGTGYSSLNYLHSLPLRLLKIDQTFVQKLDGASSHNSTTVVAAIVALARALHIQVIAEGVETLAQRSALLAMGCELWQGFLLGRPAPISHWAARRVNTEQADHPA